MENKSHAMAAGAFVLVVAALLAGLAVWLTRDSANYREFELSSGDAVSGLQPQAAVRYKGVAVGKVVRIGFDPQMAGNVLIRIAVKEDAPIGPTTFATLGFQGVTGLAHVLLDDAGKPYPALPAGPSGLPRLPLQPSTLGRLSEQAPAILGRVEEATRRLNQALSDDNQARLGQTLEHLRQTMGHVNHITERLDASLAQHLDPTLAALPPLVGEARQTLQSLQQVGQSVSAVATQLGQTAQRLNTDDGALAQITRSTQALAQAAEQLGTATLPRVHRATEDAGRAARQVGRAASGFQDNPQSLLYGAGAIPPGPGEAGFVAPVGSATPSRTGPGGL